MKTRKLLAVLLTLAMCLGMLPGMALADNEVAKIGETGYESLAAAIAAVPDGETITLQRDIELTGSEIVDFSRSVNYTIDGDGHKITPKDEATLPAPYHRFNFGPQSGIQGPYGKVTLKNLTISDFSNSTYFIRAESCAVKFENCTITENAANRVFLATFADVEFDGCTFSSNTSSSYLFDFNTNADNVNRNGNNAAGALYVHDCLFTGNTAAETGLIYAYGSTSDNNRIINNTFSNNTVESDAAAVIYCSGTVDHIENNLFTGNTVTATSASQKEGVIVLGSSTTGTNVKENAFVSNTLGTTASKYGTVYVNDKDGYTCDLSNNYWGDGQAAETGTGEDIYRAGSGTVTNTNYADSYTPNANSNGVTVTLHSAPAAQNFYQDSSNENLWHIANLAGLKAFRDSVNSGTTYAGKTVQLDESIVMDNESWTPIGAATGVDGEGHPTFTNTNVFEGIFDGNSKTISNLYINDSTLDGAGLFGKTGYGSTIKDLTLNSPSITARIAVGALAADVWASTISNVAVTGTIQITGNNTVGGLAGQASHSKIVNCTVNGTSKSSSSIIANKDLGSEDGDNVGGLVGMRGPSDPIGQNDTWEKQATVNCSVSNVTLQGWRKVGGLFGQSYNREATTGTVSNIDIVCTASAAFAASKAETLAFGGMVGIYAPVSGDPYRQAEYSKLEGSVSNVTITCSNDAANAFAKMGIISGGQRGSTDFVDPTDTTFNVTVSGTNSTTGTKVSDNKTKIYSAYTAPATNVAKIGETLYATLAAAIAAVPTDNTETTITMTGDTTEAGTITIAANQNITLDLAGHTVSYSENASGKSVYFITNKGTLTVKDSATGGEIVFTATPYSTNYSLETVTVYNLDGTLNLVSGKITNASGGGLAYAVNNSSNAWGKGDDKETVFNMTGGVVSAPHGDAALRVYQNCAQNNDPYSHNTVNISGGTILDTGIFVDNNIYQATAQTTGEGILIDLNITGGTINGLIDLKLRHAFNTSLDITDGDFTNAKLRVRKQTDSSHVWGAQDEPTNPIVTISGGKWSFANSANAFNTSSGWTTTSSWTSYKPYSVSGGVFNVDLNDYAGIVFPTGKTGVDNTDTTTSESYPYTVGVDTTYVAQIGSTKYETLAEAIEDAQSGDTVTLLADVTTSDIVFINKSLTLDGNSHQLISSAPRAIRVEESNVNVTIQNLTIPANEDLERAIQVDSEKDDVTLTIDNVTATATMYTVNICGSVDDLTLNITNSDITGWGAVNLWGNNGTVTISGSTLTGVNDKTYNADGWNNFGTVIVEGDTTGATDTHASAYNISISNTTIKATQTTGNKQFALLYNDPSEKNHMTLTNCTIELGENCSFLLNQSDDGVDASTTKIKGTYMKDTSSLPVLPDDCIYVDVADGYKLVTKNYVAQIGTTKYTSLDDAYAAATDGGTITLLADINVTAQVEVGKELTLDLNGHKIEYTGESTLASGVIMVLRGGNLTVEDSSNPSTGKIVAGNDAYAAIALTKAGETSTANAILTVNGGTLEGYYYGITGNGSRHGTQITINGGTIRGTCENDNLGIFHPQDGTLTIKGGTITGYSSAVEMRAGTLGIAGGTLTATAGTFSCNANASGTTTVGAAVAIAQHTTKKDIAVTITGGTFTGVYALNESNPQANDPAPQVALLISGGLFNGSAKAVNMADDVKGISGGTFSSDPSAYVATGFKESLISESPHLYGIVAKQDTDDSFTEVATAPVTNTNTETDTTTQFSFATATGETADDVTYAIKTTTTSTTDPTDTAVEYKAVDTEVVTKPAVDANAADTSNISAGKTAEAETVKEAVETSAASITTTVVAKNESGEYGDVNILTTQAAANAITQAAADYTGEANDIAKVEVQLQTELTSYTLEEKSASVATTALIFEVTPKAVLLDVGGNELASETLTNADLKAQGLTLKFRLPVPDSAVTANVTQIAVTHKSDDENYPDETKTYTIQGTEGNYYIEIETDHFSEFELQPIVTVSGYKYASGCSLSLQDSIDLYYYLYLETGNGADPADYTIKYGTSQYTFKAADKQADTITDATGTYDVYKGPAVANFYATQMSNTVTVKLYRSGDLVNQGSYSVRDYCDRVINTYNSETSGQYYALKALCQSVLDYGAAAQNVFDYRTGDLATANHAGSSESIAATVVPSTYSTSSSKADSVAQVNKTLSLESQTRILYYFTPASGYDKNSFNPVTVEHGDVYLGNQDRYGIYSVGIAPYYLDQEYTMQVSTGSSDITTTKYTPLRYAYLLTTTDDSENQLVGKTLYRYFLNTKAYFDGLTNSSQFANAVY